MCKMSSIRIPTTRGRKGERGVLGRGVLGVSVLGVPSPQTAKLSVPLVLKRSHLHERALADRRAQHVQKHREDESLQVQWTEPVYRT